MPDNASIVRQFVDQVITRGDMDAASRFVWELPGPGTGLEGLKDILRSMRSGFPGIVFSIQGYIKRRLSFCTLTKFRIRPIAQSAY
jgi:hypothetical protein